MLLKSTKTFFDGRGNFPIPKVILALGYSVLGGNTIVRMDLRRVTQPIKQPIPFSPTPTTPAAPSCNSLRADTRGHTPPVVGEWARF